MEEGVYEEKEGEVMKEEEEMDEDPSPLQEAPEVTIVIYDDSSLETEDKIFQVKFYCGGGSFANNTLRDECKIKIIDEDANILKRISASGPFQLLSALATLG